MWRPSRWQLRRSEPVRTMTCLLHYNHYNICDVRAPSCAQFWGQRQCFVMCQDFVHRILIVFYTSTFFKTFVWMVHAPHADRYRNFFQWLWYWRCLSSATYSVPTVWTLGAIMHISCYIGISSIAHIVCNIFLSTGTRSRKWKCLEPAKPIPQVVQIARRSSCCTLTYCAHFNNLWNSQQMPSKRKCFASSALLMTHHVGRWRSIMKDPLDGGHERDSTNNVADVLLMLLVCALLSHATSKSLPETMLKQWTWQNKGSNFPKGSKISCRPPDVTNITTWNFKIGIIPSQQGKLLVDMWCEGKRDGNM